jgi:hypothetical protein
MTPEEVIMRFDDCYRIINRRIGRIRNDIQMRQRQGLQVKPLEHRIEELEDVRREIAALATPREIEESES